MSTAQTSSNVLDRWMADHEYRHIGGMTANRVYQSRDGREVVKVALVAGPDAVQEKLAAFGQCRQSSRLYAPLGLMPEVFEVGEDFAGTGHPFLRERFIPGTNLGFAYLKDRAYWRERLPQELLRHYRHIQATAGVNVRAIWQDKLHGIACPSGCEEWFERVCRTGRALMARHLVGRRIHGDLQFGNFLARADEPGDLILIDWEVSEIMPLAYDFAMLYAFLLAPEGQVESRLRAVYRQQAPLRDLWERLWPLLASELAITPNDMRDFILFRMGNGWLSQLSDCRQEERAKDLRRRLRSLMAGDDFAQLPIEE